jgi:hypothetical protein
MCVVTQMNVCAWLPDMGFLGLSPVSTQVLCTGRYQCCCKLGKKGSI